MGNITEQDRLEWAQNPVTKAFLQQLTESRQEAMESWAKEYFVGSTLEEGAIRNATALGGMRVLNDLIAQIESCDPSQGDAE